MTLTFTNGQKVDICNLDNTDKQVLYLELDTCDYDNIKNVFLDSSNLELLKTDTDEYHGYTKLRSITSEYTTVDNITHCHIILEYNGLSKELDDLKTENESAQNTINMLIDCIMELSTIVYGASDSTENMEAK